LLIILIKIFTPNPAVKLGCWEKWSSGAWGRWRGIRQKKNADGETRKKENAWKV